MVISFPLWSTGGLFGQIVGLFLVQYGLIAPQSISYIMLISMSAFLVAVIRTPLTAIVLITEITGHFASLLSLGCGGRTYLLLHRAVADKTFQCGSLRRYDPFACVPGRDTLYVGGRDYGRLLSRPEKRSVSFCYPNAVSLWVCIAIARTYRLRV